MCLYVCVCERPPRWRKGFGWVVCEENVMQSAFVLSQSNSHRPLSLPTEGSLHVYMASSANRMHTEHVSANMHAQMLIVCVLSYTRARTRAANRRSDALPLTDHSTLYQNSSKHLWASIPMFSQRVLWISYRKALCLSHVTKERICIGRVILHACWIRICFWNHSPMLIAAQNREARVSWLLSVVGFLWCLFLNVVCLVWNRQKSWKDSLRCTEISTEMESFMSPLALR